MSKKSTLEEVAKLIKDLPPKPDIARCSVCGWEGSVDECLKGIDGDWETGYFEIDECPICEDGGCVDDYSYSPKQLKLLERWNAKHKKGD